MRQLRDDRRARAVLRGEARPLAPVVENLAVAAAGVDGDVAGRAEVADIDLDLAGCQEAEAASGPAWVEVAEGGDGDVVEGWLGERFLHGAFY